MSHIGFVIIAFFSGALLVSSIDKALQPAPTLPPIGYNSPIDIGFEKNDCGEFKGKLSKDECQFRLTPKTMLLSFVSRERFDAEMKDALGFSRIYKNPCEIVIPAEGRITSRPDKNIVLWGYDLDHPSIEATIVHEILHCYTGHFHPGPAALYLNNFREYQRNQPEMEVRNFKYRLPRLPSQKFELTKERIYW